ncbi:MAG: glucose-1-phosphate adenylyltransferase subunit GlgD, partial [Lachnospiraceae bacterium]|nr:glucose-1-phosphate adenylyltransferase subunit GlgD [Lachnospiraceae bacterium]
GCVIEGSIENCVIGRGVEIKKGAVLKNCIVSSHALISEGVHLENQVVDKYAKILNIKEIIATADKPGYVRRNDVL